MGKRSTFERRARDFYPTPIEAVTRLEDYLPEAFTFWEPCAGDGQLASTLIGMGGICVRAGDIEPQVEWIRREDAMTVAPTESFDLIITNPPWPRPGGNGEPAVGLVNRLSEIASTWLLLPWDFAANRYFGRVARRCALIVPIGRVSWEGNGVPGKDNAAWYRFDAQYVGPVILEPR